MGKAPPPGEKDFVLSDDDEDDVTGGGIPDDDGWIHLKEQQDGERPREGDSRKRKPARPRSKLVRRSAKRLPKRDS